MKTLFLILLFAPLFGLSQISTMRTSENEFDVPYSVKQPNLFPLWKSYLTDCNELVPDTIKQPGVVNVKYKPVIVNGEISHYLLTPIDTIWTKVECKAYKISTREYLTLGSGVHWLSDNNIVYTSTGMTYTSVEQVDNKINITRNKICHIKKRKASWDDFWGRWLIEKKIIETN